VFAKQVLYHNLISCLSSTIISLVLVVKTMCLRFICLVACELYEDTPTRCGLTISCVERCVKDVPIEPLFIALVMTMSLTSLFIFFFWWY
jgi:hypothetical protein